MDHNMIAPPAMGGLVSHTRKADVIGFYEALLPSQVSSRLGLHAGLCSPVNDSTYAFQVGTSFAAPFVAGAAALYLSDNPEALPAEVKAALLSAATLGQLDLSGSLPGTPNVLLSTLISAPPVAAAAGPDQMPTGTARTMQPPLPSQSSGSLPGSPPNAGLAQGGGGSVMSNARGPPASGPAQAANG